MRRSVNLTMESTERGLDAGLLHNRLTVLLHCLLIGVPLFAAWIMLEDFGGWPQNDDPFYGRPVQFFAEQGRLQLVRQYGELTASSLGHIVTGAAVCSVIDYSYRNLYLVCLVQQALGGVAIYLTCCRLGLAQLLSLFFALSLSLFPLYFGHAFSFMTDGPATAWASIACCSMLLGLTSNRLPWLLGASIAIAWGYWIRQTNLLLIVIPIVSLVLFQNDRLRGLLNGTGRACAIRTPVLATRLLASLGPALLSFAILESGWLVHSSAERLNDIAPDPISFTRAKGLVIGAYGACLLAGWLCVPLLPWLIGEIRTASIFCARWQRKVCWITCLGVLLALFIPFAASSGRACITSSTGVFVQNGHFGPIFLSDMDEPGRWGQLGGVAWPLWVWKLLSALSIVTCASMGWWLAWTVSQWIRDLRKGLAQNIRLSVGCALVCMVASAILLILAFVQPLMDRYWMFLFPPILLWLALVASVQTWKLSIFRVSWASLWLIAMLAMSLVFTHDLLAWNDVRWQFVNAELRNGALPHQLDAGRDVNAWFRMQEDPETSHRVGDKSPWWSGLATRCISVGPRPGWVEVDRLPWQAWATGKTHYLLVLDRNDRRQQLQTPVRQGDEQ